MWGEAERLPGTSTKRRFEPSLATSLLDLFEALSPASTLGFLFVLSLALRLYYLNDGLFLYDSVVLAQAVQDTLDTGTLHGQINGRHGSVFIGLIAHWPDRWLTGETSAERALLHANAVFAAAAVPALFLLGRHLLRDHGAAFVAALLFSLSPIYLSVTTWAKPHGLEALQIVTCFTLLARPRTSGSTSWLLGASLVYGSAILCREAALLVLPLYLLLYLRPEIVRQRPFVRFDPRVWSVRWLAAAFLPLLLMLALAFWLFLADVVSRTLTVESANVVTFRLWPAPGLRQAMADLLTTLTPVGALLAVAGTFRLARRPDLFPLLFLGAWGAGVYPVGNASAYWPRLLAVLSPPFFLALGAGASWLHTRSRVASALLVVLLGASMFAQIEPLLSQRRSFSGEKVQALWLRDLLPPASVVIAMDDAVFIEYYAGLETLSHPIDDPAATERWVADVLERIESGTPVFIVTSGLSYDRSKVFGRALRTRFRLVEIDRKGVEDYHRAALVDRRYETTLSQLVPRSLEEPAGDQRRSKRARIEPDGT